MLLIIMILVSSVAYNIYDNKRVVVVEQQVKIHNLPQSFDNFKILQITDLHEKRFGNNERRLVEAINKLDYDIIVVTGDIVNKKTVDLEPFKELMNGIKKKDLVFFVSGNNDPPVFDRRTSSATDFGIKLQVMGCTLLNNPYSISRDKDTMWIVQYMYGPRAYKKWYNGIGKEDLIIGMNHFPISKDRYNKLSKTKNIRYDLIIAGHYHGGQVRVPFLGALYVPMGGIKGFFPEQNQVSGLEEEEDFKQYISRGLGASGPKFFRFRVFDTPEINIIKLNKK